MKNWFILLILVLLLGSVLVAIYGFVLMMYWEWFIVSCFQFKSLTFLESCGLVLFWSFLRIDMNVEKSVKDEYEMFFQFISKFLTILICLVIGFLFSFLT